MRSAAPQGRAREGATVLIVSHVERLREIADRVLWLEDGQFKELGAAGVRALGKPECVVYDVKYVLPREAVDGRL